MIGKNISECFINDRRVNQKGSTVFCFSSNAKRHSLVSEQLLRQALRKEKRKLRSFYRLLLFVHAKKRSGLDFLPRLLTMLILRMMVGTINSPFFGSVDVKSFQSFKLFFLQLLPCIFICGHSLNHNATSFLADLCSTQNPQYATRQTTPNMGCHFPRNVLVTKHSQL